MKRGFLLAEETLKMIIAVVCIMFLVGLLTSLYYTNVKTQKLEQAKSVAERLGEIANNVSEGESERQDLAGPREGIAFSWYLLGFTEKTKPRQCQGASCICICESVINDPLRNIWSTFEERQSLECSENGACSVVQNLKSFRPIEIKTQADLTVVEINKQGGEISVDKVR